MRLALDSLTETPVPFHFLATPQWFRERFPADAPPAESLSETLEIEGRAYRAGADVLLEGEIRGGTELACGRCLTRYRAPVRESFRLVLEPAGARVPADPQGAVALSEDGLYLSDEAEMGWFRGQEIRLDRFIGEVISLALPVQPVCRESCKGLCPRCGVDRNVESCNCAEIKPESPFAVLGKLRGGSPTR